MKNLIVLFVTIVDPETEFIHGLVFEIVSRIRLREILCPRLN